MPFVDPDSMARALADAAPSLGRLREAYLEAGFNRQEALELCLSAQAISIGGLSADPGAAGNTTPSD